MSRSLTREAKDLVRRAERNGFQVRALRSDHGWSIRTPEGAFVTTVPGTPGTSRRLRAAQIALRKAGLEP